MKSNLNRYAKYIYLFILFLLFSGGLFYWILMKGLTQVAEEKHLEFNTLAAELRQLEAQVERWTHDHQFSELPQLVQRVPVSAEIPAFVENLALWEEHSGLRADALSFSVFGAQEYSRSAETLPLLERFLQAILSDTSQQTDETEEGQPWSILEVTVSFRGSYIALDRFINQMQAGSRLIDIYHIAYTSSVDGDGTENVVGTLVLHAYYSELFQSYLNES